MKRKNVIPHLKKCFNYAVAQNKGNSVKLAKTIAAIPDHVFDARENCGTWCYNHPDSLKKAKFSIAASSQANESLNNIMAHKAPKNMYYSLSESSDYRWASVICTKNDGEQYLSTVKEKLNLSPGKNTELYAANRDSQRKRRAEASQMHSAKCRRNLLKQDRENLRKKTENSEGVQYSPNCGFDTDINNNEDIELDELMEVDEENLDSFNIVFFDIETSGFANSADILQLAAKVEGRKFSVYIQPTQPVVAAASAVTGLTVVDDELYLNDVKVKTISLKESLDY
ncbi:uncharacterized protein LOC141532165 [Cotesia typhae]|uniref:uncharacterized protein LOC141532165 n=1 Tax=Cotesia typhae TaxID=2053667 RepID=UPI003D6896A0